MKKTLLSLLAIVFASSLSAQITLTQSNQAGAVGDVFTSFIGDTSVAPGNAGASQTWNLNIAISANALVQNFVTPASTPYASSFSTSNLANSASGSYEFYTSSSSAFIVTGAYTSGIIVTYTSTLNFLTYPFTYNSASNNPTVVGTITGLSSGTITGSVNTHGDGYGMLILNGVTHSNVLRLKSVQTLVYNFSGSGTENYSIVTYYWYDGIHHNPLLEISTTDGSGMQSSHEKFVYVADYATGVNEISGSYLGLEIYPVPANKNLTVKFETKEKGSAIVSMFNMMGELVFKKDFGICEPFRFNESIDIQNLGPGIYFLQVISGNILECKKAIME